MFKIGFEKFLIKLLERIFINPAKHRTSILYFFNNFKQIFSKIFLFIYLYSIFFILDLSAYSKPLAFGLFEIIMQY